MMNLTNAVVVSLSDHWRSVCAENNLQLITTLEDGEYCAHLIDPARNRGYMAIDTDPDEAIRYVINAFKKSRK